MSDETPEFATLLCTHGKGRAHDEASKKLREAVEAVMTTGKQATVTVKFTFSRVPETFNVLKVGSKVAATIPEEPPVSMWFADDDGGLHRNDPNQASLFDDTGIRDGKTTAAGRDQ